jgi:flagellar hook assembly protein FlgD
VRWGAIAYALASEGPCYLALYDLQGHLVRTLISETRQAGAGEVVWNRRDDHGSRVASGTYLVMLRAAGKTDLLKVTLMK